MVLCIAMLVVAAVTVWARNAAASSASVAQGMVDDTLAECATPGNCVTSIGTGPALVEPLLCTSDDVLGDLLAELHDRGWEIAAQEQVDGGTYVHAVAITRVLRFRDDVEFLVRDSDDLIRVRSASRIGSGDLGTNRARVDDLRESLAERC